MLIHQQAVDVALLSYLVANDKEGVQLGDLVTDCSVDAEEIRSLLQSNRRFHCLALHHASLNEWESALQVWDKLVKQELTDEHFPGYTYVAEQLTK